MSTKKAKLINKSKWGPGPWQSEPDRWEGEHEGFPLLITRVEHSGHLCGYVAVPPGHPWHGKSYDDVNAEVHGGITYAEACSGDVCHVPKPGEPDDVWWLGFDHAHSGDFCPAMGHLFRGESYRSIAYVQDGCRSLAEQAKAALP